MILVGKLGRLTRRVRRNQERVLKARGTREKKMVQSAFQKGLELGADLMKTRLTNATAGMHYEEVSTDLSISDDSVGPVGSDYVDNLQGPSEDEHRAINTIIATAY